MEADDGGQACAGGSLVNCPVGFFSRLGRSSTHNPPSKKTPLTIHFFCVLIFKFQITGMGRQSVAMSRTISMAPAAVYMAYSLMTYVAVTVRFQL